MESGTERRRLASTHPVWTQPVNTQHDKWHDSAAVTPPICEAGSRPCLIHRHVVYENHKTSKNTLMWVTHWENPWFMAPSLAVGRTFQCSSCSLAWVSFLYKLRVWDFCSRRTRNSLTVLLNFIFSLLVYTGGILRH